MSSAPAFAPLRSLDDALAALLRQVSAVHEVEEISSFEADGRVLAHDLVSPVSVPGFDNSAMDGYALRSQDCTAPGVVFDVAQRIAAGQSGQSLLAGQAARIFTGAPLPEGADAVVMQEDCSALANGQVQIHRVPTGGQWIRRAGEDIRKDSVVLSKGTLLTPVSIGLAASMGFASLPVLRRCTVALFSTGNELVMPGQIAPQDLPPGAIYNSNRFFLRALLLRCGVQVTDLGIVPDDLAATVQALQGAAQNHDLILTSGGVSVGEEDHIKPAVQQLGALDLWSISMKPGKPFAYGHIGGTHFIGLPGNPVSSLVTFLLLVQPFLARLQGQMHVTGAMHFIAACANFTLPKADKRREFLRVRQNMDGGLDLHPNQSSGVLTSAVWADGLVDNPAGRTIAKGDMVRYIPFAHLMP